TDFFGYNTYEPTLFAPQSVPNWVGDLILECEVTVDDPLGELVLELSRGVDRCRARWDLGSGKCTLLRLKQAHLAEERPPEDDFREVGEATTPLKGAGTHRLRFANVDQRLTVWVDEALPFDEGVAYDGFREGGPYPNDLEPASVGVRGGRVT